VAEWVKLIWFQALSGHLSPVKCSDLRTQNEVGLTNKKQGHYNMTY
jgi:hypothetical protein